MRFTVAHLEEFRRHNAAVDRCIDAYHADKEPAPRDDHVRVCRARGCTTTTRSMTNKCQEHR